MSQMLNFYDVVENFIGNFFILRLMLSNLVINPEFRHEDSLIPANINIKQHYFLLL